MHQTNICDYREVKLFKNRRNQALRIPTDFTLDTDRVRISRDGERLIVEPIHENKLLALLNSWDTLDEDFPEIEDEVSVPEEIF